MAGPHGGFHPGGGPGRPGGGPGHPGGGPGHPGKPGHPRGGSNVFFDPFGGEIVPTFPAPNQPTVAEAPPTIVLPPAQLCPSYAPPPGPTGPHIIYIGQKPTINGPKVIYGTD